MSAQSTLESLERFEIDNAQLITWENELGIEVPVNEAGEKQYSRLHINLFKNIKKHLILGRSLDEIKRMIILPPTNLSRDTGSDPAYAPDNVVQGDFSHNLNQRVIDELNTANNKPARGQMVPASTQSIEPASKHSNRRIIKKFATAPTSLAGATTESQPGQHASLVILIEKLLQEKDGLQNQMIVVEKQKSHLLKTNEHLEQQIKALSDQMNAAQTHLKSEQNLKLMDDKAKLQKQIIASEQRVIEQEKDLYHATQQINELQSKLTRSLQPNRFIGNWLEEATLQEVSFDNFGINIENYRNRLFEISPAPSRVFGHTAIIESQYDYPGNILWKRTETLIVEIINDAELMGELIIEYILDGTIIAKAIYTVQCIRTKPAA